MDWSYKVKTVGVLFLLVLLFAFPIFGHAEENQTDDSNANVVFVERILGFDHGAPFIPEIPTAIQPGTFFINLVAYEQRVHVDEKFAWIISYAYSGESVQPAKNVSVKITLSEEIKYIDFYDEDLNQLVGYVNVLPSGEQEITFLIDGSINTGTLSNIIVVAKLDDEKTQLGDIPYASVEINADAISTASTEAENIIPVINPSDWQLIVYKDYPIVTPAPGGEVTYGITLYGNSEDNGLNLKNVKMQITYPLNAIILDDGGGAIDDINRTITWEQEILITEEMTERWITLKYPSDYFDYVQVTSGDKVSKVAISSKAYANVSGMEGTFLIESSFEHGFAKPSIKLGSTRNGETLDSSEYCNGDLATFTIYGLENKGNVSFENAYITMEVPDNLFLQFVDTGRYNMDVQLKVQYKTAQTDTWQNWKTVSSLKSTRLNVSELGYLDPITDVRWVFSEGDEMIKPGFSGRDTARILATVAGDYGDDTDVGVLLQAKTYADKYVSASSGDTLKIRTILPDDLPAWRKKIVDTSFILIGKVEYYLGGKSYVVGWDDRWGDVRYNANSSKYEPYGMDCSGYVVWVLINSGYSKTTARTDFGIATYYQWPNCYTVSASQLLPGDMVFRQPPTAPGFNHIGIVVGRDNSGNLLVAHCAGSYNTVVVTPYAGTFYYMKRPFIYN